MIRKTLISALVLPVLLASAALTGCSSSSTSYDEPIMPSSFRDRPVDDQGTATVLGKDVIFRLWDSQQIDGDIITFVVNDKVIADTLTLTGQKRSYSVSLHDGYNYILLFAHNVGALPPNTAAVAVDDGVSQQTLVLSANLQTHGAMNLLVQK
jgi:hypothetical protein